MALDWKACCARAATRSREFSTQSITLPGIPRPILSSRRNILPQTSAAKPLARPTCCSEFGLPRDTRLPVVGIVSRFVPQKGFDLIQQVADRLALEELILIVLGNGQREYEEMFRRLNKQYPHKIAVKIAYDNALAHKIEAGSDIYLMPSHYEPCGLNQIYSLRYGTVPVVRATGGLDDTVEQFDPRTIEGNGVQVPRIQWRSDAGFLAGCGHACIATTRPGTR